MKKSIFNIFVPIESQEQADRLKQVCLDNNLPIWDGGFVYIKYIYKHFYYHSYTKKFILLHSPECFKHIKSTEAEFMELLKQWKDG